MSEHNIAIEADDLDALFDGLGLIADPHGFLESEDAEIAAPRLADEYLLMQRALKLAVIVDLLPPDKLRLAFSLARSLT